MKVLLLCLCLVSLTAASQKYVLLDRQFKEPFTACDSITLDIVAQGGVPVYTEDLGAIIGQLELYAKHLATNEKFGTGPETFSTAHSHLFLARERNVLYNLVLQSNNTNFSIPLPIASGTRKSTLRELTRFIDYLRHNRAVFERAESDLVR